MNTFDHVKIPPDKQIGHHSQSGYELDYIITGRGIRTLGTVSGPFQEGEVFLVPPELSHQWAFDSRNVDGNGFIENISFHFSSCFLEKISETFPELSDKMLRLRNLTEAVQYKGKTRESLAQLLSQLDNLETNKRCPADPHNLSPIATFTNVAYDIMHSFFSSSTSVLGKQTPSNFLVYNVNP